MQGSKKDSNEWDVNVILRMKGNLRWRTTFMNYGQLVDMSEVNGRVNRHVTVQLASEDTRRFGPRASPTKPSLLTHGKICLCPGKVKRHLYELIGKAIEGTVAVKFL